MKSLCFALLLHVSSGAYGLGQPHQRVQGRVMNENIPETPLMTIGTRGSPLALAQAFETKSLLERTIPELSTPGSIVVKTIMTRGDSILSQPLSEIGGKGLFTKELDAALLDRKVDLCVHSMKDVPTALAEGTMLPSMLPREDTRDAFISRKYSRLSDLPSGAVIGSASLRRQSQLLNREPSWKVVNFRGNVQTRLAKLESGVVDATLLAMAGLKRLNMTSIIESSQVLSWEDMLPAVAQGAIGLQCRVDDSRILGYLGKLNHEATRLAVECERSFLRRLDGNCRTPIAGQAAVDAVGQLHFTGLIAMPDGSRPIRVAKAGSVNDAIEIGIDAANEVRCFAGKDFDSYATAFSIASKQ